MIPQYLYSEYCCWQNNKTDLGFLPSQFILRDHIGNFDPNGFNSLLDYINQYAVRNGRRYTVFWKEFLPNSIKNLYSNLDIQVSSAGQVWVLSLQNAKVPTINKQYHNFVCSFNGSNTISKHLLVASIHKFGWFDKNYNSKNFSFTVEQLDGHIVDLCNPTQERFYRKFIVDKQANDFYQSVIDFDYKPFNHTNNLQTLFDKIETSFIQVCSESTATKYFPYVTEKFVYPVLARTLWVNYAQPGYHEYLEHYYGFKKYDKIFDYGFDQVLNPVARLVEMLTMLSKFYRLSELDKHDLYLIEQDTINYNYEWYMSKNWFKKINET